MVDPPIQEPTTSAEKKRLKEAEKLFGRLLEAAKKQVDPPAPLRQQIRLGSDCSGLGSDFLAMKLLGCNVKPVFCSEICPDKVILMTAMHHKFGHSARVMGDISARDVESMDAVDVFVSGAPCPAYSAAGLKKALADPRGAVILHSLEYVVAKRPRITILENVRGLSQGDNKCIMQKIIEILKAANYSVRAEIVDTAQHGLPHSRNRLYIAAWQSVDGLFHSFLYLKLMIYSTAPAKSIQVAIQRQCLVEKFNFPQPVAMPDFKQFVVKGVVQKTNLCKYTDKRLREFNDSSSKTKPADGYVFMDLLSSGKFGGTTVTVGKCPCITKACLGRFYFSCETTSACFNVLPSATINV